MDYMTFLTGYPKGNVMTVTPVPERREGVAFVWPSTITGVTYEGDLEVLQLECGHKTNFALGNGFVIGDMITCDNCKRLDLKKRKEFYEKNTRT